MDQEGSGLPAGREGLQPRTADEVPRVRFDPRARLCTPASHGHPGNEREYRSPIAVDTTSVAQSNTSDQRDARFTVFVFTVATCGATFTVAVVVAMSVTCAFGASLPSK